MIPVKPKDTLWQPNSDINEFQISNVGEKLFENSKYVLMSVLK